MGKRYEIHLKSADMFWFLLRHNYTSVAGIISVILSFVGLYMLITKWDEAADTYKIALMFVVLYAPLIEPIRLYFRATRQMTSPSLSNKIWYQFEEEGVILKQGPDRVVIPWYTVSKVISTKRAIYFYLDKMRGYILPVRDLQGDEKEIAAYMKRMKEAHGA